VTVREWYQPRAPFGEEAPAAEPRYRTITADSVTVRRIKGGGLEVPGAELELVSEHAGLGFVPLVTLYCRDESTCPHPVGQGLMRQLEPIDRAILNAASWRDDWATNACFPLRGAPFEVLRAAKMAIGNATIIGLNPGDPDLQQLAVDKAPFECLSALISERIAQAKAIVGMGRGSSEESIAGRSGVALLEERQRERALFRDLLGQLERASNELDRAIARASMGTVPAELGETRYDRAFDSETFEADVDQRLGSLLGLGLPTAAQVAIRGFAARSSVRRYGDRALQQAMLAAVREWEDAQLSEAAAPPPEKPQPITLGVEQTAAITDANYARGQHGEPPRPEWEGLTVAEVMAEDRATVAAASAAVAGTVVAGA
jgi:hypothetical protein